MVFVSARVSAVTAVWKVVFPEFTTVTVPLAVSIAPANVTVPVVFTVRLPSAPVTVCAETVPLPPWPNARVTPASRVAAPSVIAALPVASVVVSVTVNAPSVMALLVVAIVPAVLIWPGAVAVRPPAKVRMSPPSPSVRLPVLLKVVVAVMLVTSPVRLRS